MEWDVCVYKPVNPTIVRSLPHQLISMCKVKIAKFLNVYPFDYTAAAWSAEVGPINRLTSLVG